MRALERRLAEQNAVVGNDAYRHAFDVRKAADQRSAVAGFELMQLGAIDNAGNDLAHIKRLAALPSKFIGGNHAIQLIRYIFRSYWRMVGGGLRFVFIQMRNRLTR